MIRLSKPARTLGRLASFRKEQKKQENQKLFETSQLPEVPVKERHAQAHN